MRKEISLGGLVLSFPNEENEKENPSKSCSFPSPNERNEKKKTKSRDLFLSKLERKKKKMLLQNFSLKFYSSKIPIYFFLHVYIFFMTGQFINNYKNE